MNPEDDYPTDPDEIIELVKDIIQQAREDPDSVELTIPLEDLERMLDEALRLQQKRNLSKEKERQARKKAQAAWEEYCQARQKAVEYGKKCGIDESQTRMLFSGKIKIANHFFSQLDDQGEILQVQIKD